MKARLTPARVLDALRDPHYRTGYALVANTIATTAVGFFYWVAAAHLYDRQSLGRCSALVSALITILPRFLPQAGRSAGRLIAYGYGASSVAALAAGAGFVTILPRLSPQWQFLRTSPSRLKETVVRILASASAGDPDSRGTMPPHAGRARLSRSSRRAVAADFDWQVPALIFQIGADPVFSGPLGVVRTLGRVGVPVHAITESGVSPVGSSRYCVQRFVWRATARDDPGQLAADLCDVGRQIGRRSVIIPVDDESAVLVAEYAAELSEHFLFSRVRSGLSRQLASKSCLDALCREHAVPTPPTIVPASAAEAAAFAAEATFPIVVKNAMVWDRGKRNAVGVSPGASSSGTRVLHRPGDLLNLLPPDGQEPSLIIQEHIPAEQSEDWFVHLYCDANSDCTLLFTGLKVRSWPPTAGSTACGYSISNPSLAEMSERFCKEIGYTGIADLDWRLDLRDGQYKLVDFNPRVGNQFRLFETEAGIDVVRALHLDLTGRDVPRGPQVGQRRIVVEHIDIPARIAYRRLGQRATSAQPASTMKRRGTTSTEFAWLAVDDPLPAIAVLTRVKSLVKVVRRARLFPPLPRATQRKQLSAPVTGGS